ncbi:MAG: hypothetical protein NUW37_18610 [Planctomycetes bacterium]|nr:hypothetical protein [Planctomycetota bacterium]
MIVTVIAIIGIVASGLPGFVPAQCGSNCNSSDETIVSACCDVNDVQEILGSDNCETDGDQDHDCRNCLAVCCTGFAFIRGPDIPAFQLDISTTLFPRLISSPKPALERGVFHPPRG